MPGFAGWRIGGNISSDAVSMGVGVLFGIVAGIPTALLVMANNRKREMANGHPERGGKNHTYNHAVPMVQPHKTPSRRGIRAVQQSYPQQDFQHDYQQQLPVVLLAGQPHQAQLPGYPPNYAQSYPQGTQAYPQSYPQVPQQPTQMIDGQAHYAGHTGNDGYHTPMPMETPKERTYRIVGESEEWLQ